LRTEGPCSFTWFAATDLARPLEQPNTINHAPEVLIVTITEALPLGAMTPLEFARRSKGFSQIALGEAALVHPNTISLAETGASIPSRLTRARIARALEVDESMLFDDSVR
jgi:DNA-binding XRE family transcriptional regulator